MVYDILLKNCHIASSKKLALCHMIIIFHNLFLLWFCDYLHVIMVIHVCMMMVEKFEKMADMIYNSSSSMAAAFCHISDKKLTR